MAEIGYGKISDHKIFTSQDAEKLVSQGNVGILICAGKISNRAKSILKNNDISVYENVTQDEISMMIGHDQESNPNISLDIINEGGSGMLNDFTFHNDTSIEDENDNFDHEELERMGIMSPEKLLKRACETLVFDEEE